MKNLLLVFALLMLASCYHSETADLVIHNARIQSMDPSMTVYEAMAVKDGKVIELGPERQILNKYASDEVVDAGLQWVYPGFIDAHCHFLGYGLNKQKVDLAGSQSFKEVIERVVRYVDANPHKTWILGRGWDENNWSTKALPVKDTLDLLFPDIPVLLQRIDGHAALVNDAAVRASKLNIEAQIEGGQIVMQDGTFTGMVIDNAADIFTAIFNEADEDTKRDALLRAQKDCFAVGLTTVHDAGLDFGSIELIERMHQSGELEMRIYAMVSDDEASRKAAEKRGRIVSDKLRVHALKVYADGSLGSRGASLKHAYADVHNHSGLQLHDREHLMRAAKWCMANNFQMATHCIGDSANALILDVYGELLQGTNDLRWRVEHAQVVDPNDLKRFAKFNIIPSVQPTHATSDMYWAKERLGPERISWAYAYKDLKNTSGLLGLGTDFPVEGIHPLHTFHAAVERTDLDGFPEGGFLPEQKLSALETLRGITIDNATVGFMENEIGSLEEGKFADIVIVNGDLLNLKKPAHKLRVLATFVHGKNVYSTK